jgi:YidC/Oxa1 family membrane protein insertase
MDNLRFILVISLVLVGSMLWQAWEQDYRAPPPAPPATGSAAPVPAPPGAAPEAPPPTPVAAAPPPGTEVEVTTDVLRVHIPTAGAGIRRLELLRYPVHLDEPDTPLVLLDDEPANLHVIQGGLLAGERGPTHEATFAAPQPSWSLAAGEDTLMVPLQWRDGALTVTKEYIFTRGSYEIKVRYVIDNHDVTAWQGRSYSQIQRFDASTGGPRLIYTYTGAVFSSPDQRYEKISFDDMRDARVERDVTNGWVAMLQHYFISALLPGRTDVPYRYYSSSLGDNRFAVGLISPPVEVAPGGRGVLEERVYVGPKLQDVLERTAEGLDLTVDYGALWFLAKPLFVCLVWLHGLTGNWGWAIILVTVLLKVLFYRLSAAGYRSMANMRRLQPRLKAIQERHKDDRARLNQAMMQIYKEEKINPFGGCLPILIQIPVFIALYWVLLESVEMRQAPFVLWIRDLSSPDPYWVLPVVMGVTMFIQQKLNPAPMDPVQEKVMQIMPFAFTIFFGFFPAGLVLYWVANNILSIGQQWLITRNMERGAKAAG